MGSGPLSGSRAPHAPAAGGGLGWWGWQIQEEELEVGVRRVLKKSGLWSQLFVSQMQASVSTSIDLDYSTRQEPSLC